MDLAQFIDTYKEAIAQRVVESYPPLYRPSENGHKLPQLLRSPLGAQADAIRGVTLSLKSHQGTNIVGEMGTGKTFIGASSAYAAGFERILVLCPPHLTRKWKREVEQTVPQARAAIVASITDLERLRLSTGQGPLFAIMSRERAKLSYRWQAAYVERWATARGELIRDEETGESFKVPCCPNCAYQIVDKDGVPLTAEEMGRKRRTCAQCRSPLWQADPKGPKRYPLADYIKKRMKGFFELLVGDEIHEYKGRGSAQGIAAGVLADSCGRSLTLTGTLSGGYSSTLFHLLYRFSPAIRTEFGRSEEGRWIQRYGFEEHTIGKDNDESVEDGRYSRRRRYRKVVRERPGLAPAALFHLIGNSVFLRLSDVASGLPSYEEQIMLCPLDSEPDSFGYTQRGAYGTLYEKLRAALTKALAKGSKKLLSVYLQSLLAYPDGCTRGETVFDPETEDVLVQGTAPLRGEALSEGEGAGGPGCRREAGGAQGAGLRHPYGDAGHHGSDEGHPYPPRLPGGGDEGRRRGPGPQGGVGGAEGEGGHRRAHLPPPSRADRPGPDRISHHSLGGNGLQRLRHAAGIQTLMAHRPDPARQGGVHGLPGHPPG